MALRGIVRIRVVRFVEGMGLRLLSRGGDIGGFKEMMGSEDLRGEDG